MLMESFGLSPTTGGGQAAGIEVRAQGFLHLVKYCVDKKALSATNTSMSWDAIEQASFAREEALVLTASGVPTVSKAWNLKGRTTPAQDHLDQRARGQEGRQAVQSSHPIAMRYRPSRRTRTWLHVALASQPIPNSVIRSMTNRRSTTAGSRCRVVMWMGIGGAAVLKYELHANHPKIGQYNAVIFKGIRVRNRPAHRASGGGFRADELPTSSAKTCHQELERRYARGSGEAKKDSPCFARPESACPISRALLHDSGSASPCSSGRRWCWPCSLSRRSSSTWSLHSPTWAARWQWASSRSRISSEW